METDSSKKVRVFAHCKFCYTTQVIEVDLNDIQDWQNGNKYIQDALPYLSAAERELLLSGTCDKCWKEMFGESEEDA